MQHYVKIILIPKQVRTEVKQRFEQMMHLKAHAGRSVVEARNYVTAMLYLQVYSHSLYKKIKADPHAGHYEHK